MTPQLIGTILGLLSGTIVATIISVQYGSILSSKFRRILRNSFLCDDTIGSGQKVLIFSFLCSCCFCRIFWHISIILKSKKFALIGLDLSLVFPLFSY